MVNRDGGRNENEERKERGRSKKPFPERGLICAKPMKRVIDTPLLQIQFK